MKRVIPSWVDENARNMMGESVQSYLDSGGKIAEIQGHFIVTLELFKRIYHAEEQDHGNREFYQKIIRQRLESAELILKTNEKNIRDDEYTTLKKMLEKQWKLYHELQIVFQKLDSKKG